MAIMLAISLMYMLCIDPLCIGLWLCFYRIIDPLCILSWLRPDYVMEGMDPHCISGGHILS
jgi:hypothetical protein